MSARLLGTWTAGSPEWREARQGRVGGSDVAAIIGMSPWSSPYTLWHEMKGLVQPKPQNDAMTWGNRLEPVIADAFSEAHDEFTVGYEHGAVYAHPERDWQVASPDALLYANDSALHFNMPCGGLEIKTSRYEWDEIPAYYATQIQWCMDVFNVPTWHVAALFAGSDYKEFVVEANPAMQDALRAAARDFLDSLDAGVPPPLDDTDHTYRTVKELHPDIDGTDIDLGDLGAAYVAAKRDFEASKAALTATTSLVADAMGNARNAVWNGQKIARRQNGKGGPHLTSVNGLLEKYPAA